MEYAISLKELSKSFKEEKVLKNITQVIKSDTDMKGALITEKISMFGKYAVTLSGTGYIGVSKKIRQESVRKRLKEIGKEIDFPESVGIIIENPGFLPDLSGFENLKRLAALNHRIGDEEIRECIRKVGLDPFSKKKVKQYSLGMRERLGIAQAIMENPQLIILDEPFNGLDKRGVEEVCLLLRELRKKGKTIIMAAHNMPDMDGLCDTICEMDAGVLTRIK